ncbi:MAG: hypothetical protein N4A47_00200 [Clostridia bacterium]|nr:hypothetical protein [Clostridia bacterium]
MEILINALHGWSILLSKIDEVVDLKIIFTVLALTIAIMKYSKSISNTKQSSEVSSFDELYENKANNSEKDDEKDQYINSNFITSKEEEVIKEVKEYIEEVAKVEDDTEEEIEFMSHISFMINGEIFFYQDSNKDHAIDSLELYEDEPEVLKNIRMIVEPETYSVIYKDESKIEELNYKDEIAKAIDSIINIKEDITNRAKEDYLLTLDKLENVDNVEKTINFVENIKNENIAYTYENELGILDDLEKTDYIRENVEFIENQKDEEILVEYIDNQKVRVEELEKIDEIASSISNVDNQKDIYMVNQLEENETILNNLSDDYVLKSAVLGIEEYKNENEKYSKSYSARNIEFIENELLLKNTVYYTSDIKTAELVMLDELKSRDIMETINETIVKKDNIDVLELEKELRKHQREIKNINSISNEHTYAMIKDGLANFTENEKIIRKKLVKPKKYKGYTEYELEQIKTISIIGASGIGKTNLATNIAWVLSENGERVVLVDSDYKHKDIYYHFPKNYANSMSLLKVSDDVTKLKQKITKNLYVYSEHPEIMTRFDGCDIIRLIEQERSIQEKLIIDVSSELDLKVQREILLNSDLVILVINQNELKKFKHKQYINNIKNSVKNIVVVVNDYHEIYNYDINNTIGDILNDANINIKDLHVITGNNEAMLKGLANRNPSYEYLNKKEKQEYVNFCSKISFNMRRKVKNLFN